ncbi:hypothetical protein ACIP1T_23750 [Pseudomonas japonica]|uniref:hypothetical protein n=1 Tax=Pseudomonas japonica TaxID=256466 RepID=UPI00380BAEE2
MLTIRNAQRVALLDAFVVWTLDYLREQVPTQQFAPPPFAGGECDQALLRKGIESVCERGLAAGLEDTRLLLRLVLIVASMHPTFLQDEHAARILDDRTRSAERRLDDLALLAERSR